MTSAADGGNPGVTAAEALEWLAAVMSAPATVPRARSIATWLHGYLQGAGEPVTVTVHVDGKLTARQAAQHVIDYQRRNGGGLSGRAA